jgi:hypothetical protein
MIVDGCTSEGVNGEDFDSQSPRASRLSPPRLRRIC